MINNLFLNYQVKSNSDIKLRVNDNSKYKRLYVSKKLIGKYLALSDKGDVILSSKEEGGLRVNNQAFISLNRLSDNDYQELKALALSYDKGCLSIIDK